MRIDCIIQSTNYSDMLALTLPLNKGHFDSVTIYTKTGDTATQEVCAREGVTCIETDRFTQNGSKFNRGAVYNEAFWRLLAAPHLDAPTVQRDWICILDSDIVLPPVFRFECETLGLDRGCFYGARRYNVETLEQWQEVCTNPEALKKLTLFRGYGYGYLSLHNVYSSTFMRLWIETGGNPYLEWHDGSWADCAFRLHWGDHPWDPPTQPPDHILDHTIVGLCDPPTGLLRQLPFNVIHLGVTGVGATGRGTPLWNIS